MKKGVGLFVPAGDVDFDIDVALRLVDGIGHGLDALFIVSVNADIVAHDRGKASEMTVELDDGFDFGLDNLKRMVRYVSVRVVDGVICFLLDAVTAPIDLRRTHEQKQRQADERQQQNSQQPRRGRRRTTAFRNESDSKDFDGVIQNEKRRLPKT